MRYAQALTNLSITYKRKITAAERRRLDKYDFVVPETMSFPISRPEDVPAAVAAWGRGTAARQQGVTFDDFKRRLTRIARRKGPKYVSMLPESWQAEEKAYQTTIRNLLEARVHRAYTVTLDDLFMRGYMDRDERLEVANRIGEFLGLLGEAVDADGTGGRIISPEDVAAITEKTAVNPQSSFIAYKGNNGRYNWIGISSNSYQDRDQEWVTQVAQEKDVDRMNETGRYGSLDWWHTKLKTKDGRSIPLDIGTCNHATMIGRFRLESGYFYDDAVGASFVSSKQAYKMSLEFLHPANEPAAGSYNNIFTIRRSVLPALAASNQLTGFNPVM